jgi:membrane-associated HD superfamily phosphohydrolase
LYSSRKDKWVKMKRYKKIIILAVGNLLVLSACSRQPDLDAKSYVQSSLDAYYHGDYKDYANLLEISEKDAKKEIEEDFNESIQQQFDYSDNITDKGIADYAKKLVEVKKLAKYKVQDEKKDEDGNYTVSVKVEPSDVFQTLQQSSAEVSKEKIVQGMKETDPGVFASVLTESVQKSIDKNSYGAPVTVTVKVEKNHSGTYELSETERRSL